MGVLDFLKPKKEECLENETPTTEVEDAPNVQQPKLFGTIVEAGIDFGDEKKTPREAGIEILGHTNKEMHISEIAKFILKYQMVEESDLDKLTKSLGSALNNESKKKKSARITKINRTGKKQGWYKIKQKRNPKPKPIPDSQGTETVSLTSTVLGTAGEYAVVSELLFNGYNANIMIIDDGIDIIASKDNRHFFIQVKTTTKIDVKGRVHFPKIDAKRFSKYDSSGVFYVFVFRYYDKMKVPRHDYFILSASDIESLRNEGFLVKDGAICLKVIYENGSVYVYDGDNKKAVDYMMNNFSRIK